MVLESIFDMDSKSDMELSNSGRGADRDRRLRNPFANPIARRESLKSSVGENKS